MAQDPFDSNSIFPTSIDTFPSLADYGSIEALSLPSYHTKFWASNYNKISNFINNTQGYLINKSPTIVGSLTLSQPVQVFSLPLLDVLKQLDTWLYSNSKSPTNYLPFEVIISSEDVSWKFFSGRVNPESFYSYKTSASLNEMFNNLNIFTGSLLCSAALDLNYETLTNKTAGFQDNFIVNSYVTVNDTNRIVIRGSIIDAYYYVDPKPVTAPTGLVVGGSFGTNLPSYTGTNWLALGSQRKLNISLMGVQ